MALRHVSNTILLLLVLSSAPGLCLNNGLALTPPMGWLSWARFDCNMDCSSDPDTCIGERLLMMQADAMAEEGYKDAGYEYITVDDCWPADKRDSQGRLQADPRRFPRGMKAVADYIHSKGLKLGVYEDVGRHTCAGAPGTIGHYQLDAQTFADWGVDMLKFDGCNVDGTEQLDLGYPAMGKFLNQTGRKILYSCEWPLYERAKGGQANYTACAEWCNTWRVYGDIYDAWQSITSVLSWYASNPGNFSQVSGHGNWNDGDMITLGNYGLSPDQERVQMGMWSMVASPLLMSVDLRKVNPRSKALLQNRRVLSISQDPLGIEGRLVMKLEREEVEVWTRPVVPQGSYAVAYINYRNVGWPLIVSTKLSDIGLNHPGGYNISEVFDGGHVDYLKPSQNFTTRVNPTGIVLIRATIMGGD